MKWSNDNENNEMKNDNDIKIINVWNEMIMWRIN